jgi:hypothetical protein
MDNHIIDTLVEETGGKFSRDEIENFVNVSNNIANSAVLSYLIKVLTTDVLKENKQKTISLVHEIEKLKYKKKTGYMSCSLYPQLSLNLGMVLCKSDYTFTLNAPDSNEFLQDLADNIEKLVRITAAFWRQFYEDHPGIINQSKKLKPDINFDALAFDSVTKTMIFALADVEKLTPVTCNWRIGVFPCWVDGQGRPFIKK